MVKRLVFLRSMIHVIINNNNKLVYLFTKWRNCMPIRLMYAFIWLSSSIINVSQTTILSGLVEGALFAFSFDPKFPNNIFRMYCNGTNELFVHKKAQHKRPWYSHIPLYPEHMPSELEFCHNTTRYRVTSHIYIYVTDRNKNVKIDLCQNFGESFPTT